MSKNARDECSYQLVFTNDLTFTEAPSELFQEKARALQDAESEYEAVIANIFGRARTLMNMQERCEAKLASLNTQEAERKRNWNLVGGGLGIIAGASVRSSFAASAAVFSGVWGIAKIIQAVSASKGSDKLSKACSAIDDEADALLRIQNEGLLTRAMDRLIAISKELTALEASFSGYTKAPQAQP
jgi:hypothetical protein